MKNPYLVRNHFVLKVIRRLLQTGGQIQHWYVKRLQDLTGNSVLIKRMSQKIFHEFQKIPNLVHSPAGDQSHRFILRILFSFIFRKMKTSWYNVWLILKVPHYYHCADVRIPRVTTIVPKTSRMSIFRPKSIN